MTLFIIQSGQSVTDIWKPRWVFREKPEHNSYLEIENYVECLFEKSNTNKRQGYLIDIY